MYTKIFDILIEKFIQDRDQFWNDVEELEGQYYQDFGEVKETLSNLLEKCNKLTELEKTMDFVSCKKSEEEE